MSCIIFLWPCILFAENYPISEKPLGGQTNYFFVLDTSLWQYSVQIEKPEFQIYPDLDPNKYIKCGENSSKPFPLVITGIQTSRIHCNSYSYLDLGPKSYTDINHTIKVSIYGQSLLMHPQPYIFDPHNVTKYQYFDSSFLLYLDAKGHLAYRTNGISPVPYKPL